MSFKIELTQEQYKLFTEHGTIVHVGNKKYYHLPMWIEWDPEDEDWFTVFGFHELPQELKDFINEYRKEGGKVQPVEGFNEHPEANWNGLRKNL